MNKEQIIELSEDEKAVALKATSDLYFAAQELHEQIKEDRLNEEMKETMMSLLEHYIAEVAEPLKFDSRSAEKIAANHQEIREANIKIHELKKQLGDKNPIVGLTESLGNLKWALYHWWKSQGFSLVSEESFGSFGFKGKFVFMVEHVHCLTMSKTPATDEKRVKNKIEEMMESGFDMEHEEGGDWCLLDNDKNKKKVYEVIKAAFPSAQIVKWETIYMYHSEKHRLRECEVYIRNLEEIQKIKELLGDEVER